MKKFLCRVFGHNFDLQELFMKTIKAEAVSEHGQQIIECPRCGERFVVKGIKR